MQSVPIAAPAVELVGIDKRFGKVHANKSIDLAIASGTIHGIVGENGAGKSTLMSILYGFYEAEAGEIRVKGRPIRIRSSSEAISHGIGMVHQHFMLVENFTVLENIMLGVERHCGLGRARSDIRRQLKVYAEEYGLDIDPDAITSKLPVGLQQRVEILKALIRGADVLILDEPTAVLAPAEADNLFKMLRVLRNSGKTVVLITHKLREVMAITDRCTVIRRGEVVATYETSETNPRQLAEAMVGRSVLLRVEKPEAQFGEPVLEVSNLTVTDPLGVARVKSASFSVHAGEIVGIAGVSGNGQTELLQAIGGILPVAGGSITLGGQDIVGLGPEQLHDVGVGHVPEDRHRMGLVLRFEQSESAILGYQRDPKYRRGPFLDRSAIRADARRKIAEYDIQPPDCSLKTANFSGGNQQKIVLAREMERAPRLLLVGQPTRGVDIGAIEFIHKRLIALRDSGVAILLLSVELDEILALSDRILVMCDGHIVGQRIAARTDQNELGLLMAGVADTVA